MAYIPRVEGLMRHQIYCSLAMTSVFYSSVIMFDIIMMTFFRSGLVVVSKLAVVRHVGQLTLRQLFRYLLRCSILGNFCPHILITFELQ